MTDSPTIRSASSQSDVLRVTLTYGVADGITFDCQRKDFNYSALGVEVRTGNITNIYPMHKILAVRIEEM